MDMMMEVIQRMEQQLQECLASGQMSAQDLHVIGEIMDVIKDAETVNAMRGESGGYSNGHYVRGHYSNGYSGDSYSRNRSYGYSGNRYSNGMENDGMYMSNGSYGNYSGYGRSNGNYGRYSRDDAQERMRQQLERMMGEAQSDQVREALQGALSRMG